MHALNFTIRLTIIDKNTLNERRQTIATIKIKRLINSKHMNDLQWPSYDAVNCYPIK